MSKQYLIAVLFALTACATDSSAVVEDSPTGKTDDYASQRPHGDYKFEPTLSGLPSSGDILTLSLAPGGAFRATISDELSGTTSHTGTYKLYRANDDVHHYIDFIEGTHRQRFEYEIDVVDLSTLWLFADHWFGMSAQGVDCTTSGCATGETCTSCWGENVCMPQGTDC